MRLDWRSRIAAANLPAPAGELIVRVVKRTRLWRIEKSAVADELVSHFLDGLEAGETVDGIVKSFGPEEQAAKLIRRSKIRSRPLSWQVFRWARRGLATVIVVYLGLAGVYFFSHPTVNTDYIARLNERLAGVADSGRGWVIYRQAILAAGSDWPDNAKKNPMADWMGYSVDGKRWPDARKWLRVHGSCVELIRQASSKPYFGFVLGPDKSVNDDALWPGFGDRARKNWAMNPVLSHILLPALNDTRLFAEILQADAKQGEIEGDGGRV
jgi:hypothetical protein